MDKERHLENIQRYYLESESAYFNWGQDEQREGIYTLHTGYTLEESGLSHYEEVKELSRQLIRFAEIPKEGVVLDAGCGAGALSFEITESFPETRVYGVNVALNQLISAERYRRRTKEARVAFTQQDFNRLGFPSGVFERVIFCESFIHSKDKPGLAREVFRVLKHEGKLVMSDTFTRRLPGDNQERAFWQDLQEGWYVIPVTEKKIESFLKNAGFREIVAQVKTPHVLGSAKLMADHVQKRINEGKVDSMVLQLSRKATVACGELFARGVLDYYFLSAGKPE